VDIHTSALGWKVIGCAIEVHKELGPGLLESAYDRALALELGARGIRFRQQVSVPAEYKGQSVGRVYRIDFLVQNELVVELKATGQLAPAHRAQLRTYLRILNVRQGLLLNFNFFTSLTPFTSFPLVTIGSARTATRTSP
jgi:GxxExxY protein